MKKIVTMAAAVVLASAVAVFAHCGQCGGDKADGTNAAGKACCKATGMYVCSMDKTVSMKPGKCAKCGMELTKMNVLAVKDGVATVCPCEPGCKCTVNADDATKCSCGKDVVTVECKKACKVEKPTPPAAAETK
jgi:hypothetical protein